MSEFIGAAALVEKWVGKLEDPQQEFYKIDKSGGGAILFDEFCDWCVEKNLDLDEDDDYIADYGKVDARKNNTRPATYKT